MVSRSDVIQVASKLFDEYDGDNSGFLTRAEFGKLITLAFKQVDPHYVSTDQKINKLFTICDVNNDNKISRKELSKAVDLFLNYDETNK